MSLTQSNWLLILLAPLVTACAIRAMIRKAWKWGLVDRPGGRKMHDAATPLIGGLAIYFAFVCVNLASGELPGDSLSLLAAMSLAVAGGVIDDARDIGHRSKFTVQVLAALIIVSGTSVHVTQLGNLAGIGEIVLGKWAYLVTTLSIIGLMNAVNMIDGLDGLAGSLVALPLVILAGVAATAGESRLGFEMAVLAGAVGGFLFFNLRTRWRARAVVFMGDPGGLLLGLLLAWYSVKLAGTMSPVLKPITAVWILAVPLLEMGSVMLLRIGQHKSPFQADRQHLHHLLVDAGYSVPQVVAIMSAISLGLALVALIGERAGVPEVLMFVAFLGLWAGYLWALLHRRCVLGVAMRIVAPRHSSTTG